MAFTVDENGNISLVQGDSGTLVVDGIDTDKNYTVYLGIQDKNIIHLWDGWNISLKNLKKNTIFLKFF